MGLCLCKDKVEEVPSNENGPGTNNENNHLSVGDRMISLSETIDRLVTERLQVISIIADDQPDPFTAIHHFLLRFNEVTDKPTGWIQLVKSLVRLVPIEHPMGLSVITFLLENSSLPTKESALEVADMVTHFLRRTPLKERNLCVILGYLAEKLAEPSSVVLLSETTLEYLLGNLHDGVYPDVILFSLIALEKFAQKSENKATITRKLSMFPENPLVRLERHFNSDDSVLRQIGFCAKWCLDNYFVIEGRKYSYETVDLSNINVMLNTKDVSEYLKISPDGLEARSDTDSFESVKCTYEVKSDCWYFECQILTNGVMQIGWATKPSKFLSDEGYGIGDDEYSISFDGYRRSIWHFARSLSYNLPTWTGGSILGCLLDLDKGEVVFSLNGIEGSILKPFSSNAGYGYLAAASFMCFQQCRFNFGSEPFRYPPKHRNFNSFNGHAVLKPQDKVVLPRHVFLEQLRKQRIRKDSCTLCYDMKGTIRIEPCKHRGFCLNCTSKLQYCPMCRGEILSTEHEQIDSLSSEECVT